MKPHQTITCFVAALGLSLQLASAQTNSGAEKPLSQISGVVTDAGNQEGLAFATVVLLSPKDSSVVAGATTSLAGAFAMEGVPYGTYLLRSSLVGYQTVFLPQVSVAKPQMQLTPIKLGAGLALKEVEITTEKDLITVEPGKKVIHVAKDMAAQSGSVAEVLQRVPSVEVSDEGAVSLRGSGDVQVLVNGKPSAMTKAGLANIPAGNIERIEVITNPSAKYDAQQSGGIINLILKQEREKEYFGLLNFSRGSFDRYNTGLNLGLNRNKINLTADYSFRRMAGKGYMEKQRVTPATEHPFLDQEQRMRGLTYFHQFRLEGGYNLTDKQRLSASLLLNTFDRTIQHQFNYRFFDKDKLLVSDTKHKTKFEWAEKGLEANLGYLLKLNKAGHEIALSGTYSQTPGTEHTFTSGSMSDFESEVFRFLSNVDNESLQAIADATYARPLGENSKLEAGLKSTWRSADSDLRRLENSNQGWQPSSILGGNHFLYQELVNAAFGEYNNKYKAWSYKLGLRAEQTLTKANQKTSGQVFGRNYIQLFPSLSLSRQLLNDHSIDFSYSRRIDRPGDWLLNPFIDYFDEQNIRFGNPALRPELTDVLEVSHQKQVKKGTFTSTLFLRRISDEIYQHATVLPDGRFGSTFLNVGTGTSYGVELSGNYNFTSWYKVNGSISGFRSLLRVSEEVGQSLDTYSWTAKLNSFATIAKDWNLQLSARYNGRSLYGQGEMMPFFTADLGLRKDVLKKRATISMQLTDVFNTMQRNMELNGNGFSEVRKHTHLSQVFYVGFNYRFGNINKVKNKQPVLGGGGDGL